MLPCSCYLNVHFSLYCYLFERRVQLPFLCYFFLITPKRKDFVIHNTWQHKKISHIKSSSSLKTIRIAYFAIKIQVYKDGATTKEHSWLMNLKCFQFCFVFAWFFVQNQQNDTNTTLLILGLCFFYVVQCSRNSSCSNNNI